MRYKQYKKKIQELEKELELQKLINSQAYDMSHNGSISQHKDNQRNRRIRSA